MKHKINITFLLLFLFLGAHIIGLRIIDNYLPKQNLQGETTIKDLPLNIERPEVQEKTSFVAIFFIIIISTLIALLLIKFNAMKLWKLWFFVSVFLTLTIGLTAFIPQTYAIILALIVASIKLFKPNVIINNLAELFIYGGLSAIFVPILSLFSISVLLVLISIYDFYSVYKSKHMIKLAKFQTKSKIFAGINIPYQIKEKKKIKFTSGILGGGDLGFTLFFSGVILKEFGFNSALIVSFVTTLFLLGLFLYGKKGKFYPAMPVLTAGCFLGLLIIKFIF